jgi:DNA polymerase III sliding clamp (beta) subunit (PCNA family)
VIADHGDFEAKSVEAAVSGEKPMKTLKFHKGTLARLKAMLEGHKGIMNIRHDADGNVTIDMGHRYLRSRLAVDTFPNYAPVIVDKHDIQLTIAPAELLAAVRRTVLMLTRSEEAIVTLTAAANSLVVEADSKEDGSARETVGCQATVGHTFRVRASYLQHALNVCEGDTALIRLSSDPMPRPIRFEAVGRPTTVYVMPITKERKKAA